MWADVDASESLLINYLFGVFLRPGSSEQRKTSGSIFLSFTPNNDTTNLSANYPLPVDYANDHNQLPQCFQVCYNATIRTLDHAYTN